MLREAHQLDAWAVPGNGCSEALLALQPLVAAVEREFPIYPLVGNAELSFGARRTRGDGCLDDWLPALQEAACASSFSAPIRRCNVCGAACSTPFGCGIIWLVGSIAWRCCTAISTNTLAMGLRTLAARRMLLLFLKNTAQYHLGNVAPSHPTLLL